MRKKEARSAADRLRRQQQSEEQQETRLAQLRSNQAECFAAVILAKSRHISYAYQHQKCCTLAALAHLAAGAHTPQSMISLYI